MKTCHECTFLDEANVKKFLPLLAVIFILSGCSVTPESVEISYAPRPGIQPTANTYKTKIAVQIDDRRLQKFRLSNIRSTFIDTTPIFVRNDVTSALQWAVGSELRNLGFSLVDESPDLIIVAELARFDIQYVSNYVYGTAVANIHFHVIVYNKQFQYLYQTTVSAQTIGEDWLTSKGETARLALNKALENGLDQLFANKAFVTTLQTGTPPSPAMLAQPQTAPVNATTAPPVAPVAQ